ncbi:MAG: hypothetical protein Greene071421_259 [Parcubacteria group bacterium Greene0714_21]|nr:MAG: hypothetical protein Greene041639_276 [Parcubacteria group bacterium Greene0416_39]TSC97547.1 MAG: hypothetical protein Greene101447_472 [Parcubacteria group bacterium Greene1014_47]TSD04423.1 MAG: hypothetical protein Greene071421_259 [Parcubacteria group bacterium Greene0714_21]
MPAKNVIKSFVEGGYYHIYNRGVAKQNIFPTEKDYRTFLYFLKEYLLPPEHQDLKNPKEIIPRRKPLNCNKQVHLLAYCLMPNHFHLLIKNLVERGMEKFMRALATSYSGYFNRTYQRVGPLFQGRYKAVLIERDEQFVYVSKYIHQNPKELLAKDGPLCSYPYSSYPNYLGKRKQDWVDTNEIFAFFSQKFPQQEYKVFVEELEEYPKDIASLLLE